MGYTPLPHHIIHESPVKKVVATVLIAMFLGIGAAYAINRNSSKQSITTPAIESTIVPSTIPTDQSNSEPTLAPTLQDSQDCPAGKTKICEGGICLCDSSESLEPTQSAAQVSSSCPTGTVKVCQAGECECLSQ